MAPGSMVPPNFLWLFPWVRKKRWCSRRQLCPLVCFVKHLRGSWLLGKDICFHITPSRCPCTKAVVRGCRETGKEVLSNSMANGTAYLSHISDLPSKVFCVQGESSQKHLFFSMTSSVGLIVTRSQKPSSCVCVCVCVCNTEI